MKQKSKLTRSWEYTYEEWLQDLFFHGHSSVWVNESKPNITIYAEPSVDLVLKRASWGDGRIIVIDPSQLEVEPITVDMIDTEVLNSGCVCINLPDEASQQAHNERARLGHEQITEGGRTIWLLSHKKLHELEKNGYAMHIPILEEPSSFFNDTELDLPSLQAWHFLEVVKAFINGKSISKAVLEQYYPLLQAVAAHQQTQSGQKELQLPCVVGGGLGKPSYYTSVNTSFLNSITGAFHIKNMSFVPDNPSHAVHLKSMPKELYLWLSSTIIGNEDKPISIAELIEEWGNVMSDA